MAFIIIQTAVYDKFVPTGNFRPVRQKQNFDPVHDFPQIAYIHINEILRFIPRSFKSFNVKARHNHCNYVDQIFPTVLGICLDYAAEYQIFS